MIPPLFSFYSIIIPFHFIVIWTERQKELEGKPQLQLQHSSILDVDNALNQRNCKNT
ncbi:hypothetical protein L228DRAFT_250456, partial [Xylona heveae TC161]